MRWSINWKDRIPIFKWLPLYSVSALQSDFVAGITVGLVVIPQGLAYAVIAGLPPEYGLYSAFMGSFVYCFFGSSKDVSLGPTAIMSLIVCNYARQHDVIELAVALSFCCGIIWLLMGLLSLGLIVRVIPLPVISGFTSSAAIIIACGQLKSLFGLSDIPRQFLPGLLALASKIGETKIWDLVLGLTCMLLLELLKRFNTIEWPSEEESPPTLSQRISRKILWLVCIGRNAIVVFISTLCAMSLQPKYDDLFSLTGSVKEGLPRIKVPNFQYTQTNSSVYIIPDIGSGLFVVPLIGFLSNIAIAQAFAHRNHYTVNPSQELIALGVANIAGSFFSAFPVTGSFSRTTINAVSGVVTPLGGVFTGLLVLLTLHVLTPFIQYIPTSSLASIIITSVLQIVDCKITQRIWKANRVDIIPLSVTFLVSFYELDVGIISGILAALIIMLYRNILPKIGIEGRRRCYVRLHGGLTYMGTDYFTSQVRQVAFLGDERPEVVIIDCASMIQCDFTVSQGFLVVVRDCNDRDVQVIFSNVPDNVKKTLVNVGLPLELFNDDSDGEFGGLLDKNANGLLRVDEKPLSINNTDYC